MCKAKSIRLAIEGFERLQTVINARQRNGRLASKASVPRDSAELSHAREIEASAATMRAKGYAVQVNQHPNEGPLRLITITGRTNQFWADDDLRELLNECPSYAKIEDYALAVHEQYQE